MPRTVRLDKGKPGILTRLATAFVTAFDALHVQWQPQQVEQLALCIHTHMSFYGRHYHHTEHVFELFSDAADMPLVTLAAMFHDTVGIFAVAGMDTANPNCWCSPHCAVGLHPNRSGLTR